MAPEPWGNFREGSDIDLTIIGDQVTAEQFASLRLALDELPLPYTIDLSLMRQIDNPDLLAHIKRVGVVLYERGATDRIVMFRWAGWAAWKTG